MMSTSAVTGFGAGKRMLTSSLYYSDTSDKLFGVNDYGLPIPPNTKKKNIIITARNSKSSSNNNNSSFLFNSRNNQPIVRAIKEQHVDTNTASVSAERSSYPEFDVEALLLLQKSMLENQWNLSPETILTPDKDIHKPSTKKRSARRRRIANKRRLLNQNSSTMQLNEDEHIRYNINTELLQNRMKGYVKGLTSEKLLTHSEVVELSKLIKAGLNMEDMKLRLKERLDCEPSEEQLATSMRISRAELQLKLMECFLAREKLAMSNVRLVMSIAQKYDNMGAEMADLVQGGLIGLLRGIEKFDSSKGFKISTYVYWWIRQGVSKALVESSRTLRLPTHMHGRLSLIRKAKMKLEEKGISPSIETIAASLNMSQQKVKNATEAVNKVFSLDREAFPSSSGVPGATLHSYIADTHLENNPWHGVDKWALKDEVNRLISTTLVQRERYIIRLYYGLDNECLTWEDISKRIGLSRERVRQVGLVALVKLKHAARKKKLDSMLLKH